MATPTRSMQLFGDGRHSLTGLNVGQAWDAGPAVAYVRLPRSALHLVSELTNSRPITTPERQIHPKEKDVLRR